MTDPVPTSGPFIHVTQALINAYAAISGDFNPVHVDTAFAATTPFGTTIAHGCIPMEPIFRLIQEQIGSPVLPQGSRMKLRYLRPTHPGDTIGVVVKMQHNDGFDFQCVNQSGQSVIDGEYRHPAPPIYEVI